VEDSIHSAVMLYKKDVFLCSFVPQLTPVMCALVLRIT